MTRQSQTPYSGFASTRCGVGGWGEVGEGSVSGGLTITLREDVSLHGGRGLGAVVWVEGEKETERDYHY